jgi:mannose-6-phosphate isomerase-like protein (cupin superfamily)
MEINMRKFIEIENHIKSLGFNIINKDFNRPWGGFLVIDNSQIINFIDTFFSETDNKLISDDLELSPKILIVKPNCRLSWQYHFRRSEIWKIYEGKVAIVRSKTDKESIQEIFHQGETITLEQGERHRLIGLDNFGIVAEIWQHTDPNNPSDEHDIVRVQDDFGR